MAEILTFDTNEYMSLLSVLLDIRYFRLPEVYSSDFEHFSIFGIRYSNSVFRYSVPSLIEIRIGASLNLLSIEPNPK